MALREEAVQGVAELVEGGLDLVDGKHRRKFLRRGDEVADVHDDGTDVHAVFHILVPEVVHPGAAALGVAGVPVLIEDAQQGAVGIREFVGLHDGVIDLHLGSGFHVHAIDLLGGVENALGDTVGLEIGLGDGLVQVVLEGTDLLGIVEPVPRFDFVTGDSLHVGHLLTGLPHGSVHDGLQEGIDGLGIASHLVGQEVFGGVLVAQQVGLLRPEFHDLQDDGVVVILVAVVTAVGIGLEGLLAQGPVLAGGHEGRIFGHGHADGVAEGVVLRQEVLAELLAQDREAGIDLRETGLARGVQAHAVALEALVELGRHHLLLAVQTGHVVIHRLHAGEERLVHEDGIIGLRHDRGDLLLHGLHGRGGIGLGKVVEHAGNLRQELSRAFVSSDCILEGGSLRIGDDRVDFGLLRLDAGLDGGNVILHRNLAERSRPVGGVPLLVKYLPGLRAARCRHHHHQK